MSFIDRILGKKNRTAAWKRFVPHGLVVDFDDLSLCGVKLGSPFESLHILGPDDDPHATGRVHRYTRLGLDVHESDDGLKFEHLTLYMTDYAGHVPYAGRLEVCGRTVEITRRTTPEQIAGMFEGWTYRLEKDDQDGSAMTAYLALSRFDVQPSWEDGELFDIEIA